jgi:hypothetical protein
MFFGRPPGTLDDRCCERRLSGFHVAVVFGLVVGGLAVPVGTSIARNAGA